MRIVLFFSGIVMLASLAHPATIYVPDHHPTIQAAIAAAAHHDIIIVRPGTYLETIDFNGKGVRLTSQLGPDRTVIDGRRSGSVVTFKNGETSGSTIEGFTLTNGSGTPDGSHTYGGGVYCRDSSPTLAGNVITANTVNRAGAGIYCFGTGAPTITDNVVSGNSLPGNLAKYGAGIYCDECSPLITRNTIIHNDAERGYGAGIYCRESASPTIAENIIAHNTTLYEGGGISCEGFCYPAILDNRILANSASRGAGIYCYDHGSPNISGNSISCNVAHFHGGGIYCENRSSPVISNNSISGNTAEYGDGAGIHLRFESSPDIVNNTITANRVEREAGGGIFCRQDSIATIANSILWRNSAPVGPEMCLVVNSSVFISSSDVEGGQSSAHVDPGCRLDWGSGMIAADPLLADPAAGDLHLTWPSPCRDAGSVVTETTDFEGDPRSAGGAVDMGADEYYYHLYHIGRASPGAVIDIKIVGIPGLPSTLAFGSELLDPPVPTPRGNFCLRPPLSGPWALGRVPLDGILTRSLLVPTSSGARYQLFLQALVGKPAGPMARLTNSLVLTIQ